jgi:hypothetical protein
VVEYTAGGRVVAGSSPVIPTIFFFDYWKSSTEKCLIFLIIYCVKMNL